MTLQPTIEEFTALQQALQASLSQHDVLVGENRFLRVERDLLKERLDKMMRKIFAAKSEARGTEAKKICSSTRLRPWQRRHRPQRHCKTMPLATIHTMQPVTKVLSQ